MTPIIGGSAGSSLRVAAAPIGLAPDGRHHELPLVTTRVASDADRDAFFTGRGSGNVRQARNL
jgi:hypothetical protein